MPSDARDHKQGNQDRKYTDDQKAAVLRIRKCQPTAFYEILLVEKSSTDNEIKKAYRKQSLLTHPDKNGYEGADEAFKSKLESNGDLYVAAALTRNSGLPCFPDPLGRGQEVEV